MSKSFSRALMQAVPDNLKDKVMHMTLRFGDNVIMGSDSIEAPPADRPNHRTVTRIPRLSVRRLDRDQFCALYPRGLKHLLGEVPFFLHLHASRAQWL